MDRKQEFLRIGLRHARRDHYRLISTKQICSELGVCNTVVYHYFGTASAYKDEVLRHARETGDLKVLAQGLADLNPIAREAPEPLKRRALDALLA